MLMTMMAAASAATCVPGAVANRQIVSDMYREALIEKRPVSAFAKYVAPDFVEHKPGVPANTREATAQFLAGLIKSMPDAKWEVLRIVADAELVALHVRFTPAPAAPAYAIADFFRLKDCKIVEHWDVIAPPPEKPAKP